MAYHLIRPHEDGCSQALLCCRNLHAGLCALGRPAQVLGAAMDVHTHVAQSICPCSILPLIHYNN